MTLKQKILDYLRTQRKPFTIPMIQAAIGGRQHTINGYLSQFVRDRIVGYAEPKESSGKPGLYWKPRKYICPPPNAAGA